MGTRNLTIVFADGEYRLAKYCQWDGDPSSSGLATLRLLRDEINLDVLKEKCLAVVVDNEDKDIPRGEAKQKEWYKKNPQYTRDTTGAEMLAFVADNHAGLPVPFSLDFAADSLFCEWAYVVDFDRRSFEVFAGFNKQRLKKGDRFQFLNNKYEKVKGKKREYYPVRLKAICLLDDLPTDEDFLKACEDDDEESE